MTLEYQFLFTWSRMLRNSAKIEFCKGKCIFCLLGSQTVVMVLRGMAGSSLEGYVG